MIIITLLLCLSGSLDSHLEQKVLSGIASIYPDSEKISRIEIDHIRLKSLSSLFILCSFFSH